MAAVTEREARELETKQAELAEKVAEATFEQLKAKIDSDLAVIKSRMPKSPSEDANKDAAYLKDRQQSLN